MKVTKAVIPAAGLGTSLLPQTKAMPKEMLPLIDKPVIQYLVEELVAAGIQDIVIVTGWHKRAIEDHFDYPYELEQRLLQAGKDKEAAEIRRIADLANFIYVRQGPGIGNGVAIKSVSHLFKDEPFLVLWGDILADLGRSQLAVAAYEKCQRPILCGSILDEIDAPEKYGYVKGMKRSDGVWKVDGIIEKPGKENLPSPLAVCSGYVLTPEIFPILEKLHTNPEQELYLTEAINLLASQSEVLAIEMKGVAQYDTGTKLAYIETFIRFALKDNRFGPQTREIIEKLLRT